jgi:hypothetical protein
VSVLLSLHQKFLSQSEKRITSGEARFTKGDGLARPLLADALYYRYCFLFSSLVALSKMI